MPQGFGRRKEREAILPEGRSDNSPTFQGWVRMSEDPVRPEGTADFNPKGIARRIGYDVS
jgi:hypothetical protein